MQSVESLFDLDEAIDWLIVNSFKCVALELPVDLLRYSVELVNYLNKKLNQLNSSSNQPSNTKSSSLQIEFYIIVLNCCSVDYVSPRHLNGEIDAIIRFGECCLASPPKAIIEYPVLFMFENYFPTNSIEFMFKSFREEINSEDALLIVDTNYLKPTLDLINQLNISISIAKLIRFNNKWTLPNKLENYFIDSNDLINTNRIRFYNYVIDHDLINYKRIYYVGDRVPTAFKILTLLDLIHLNPTNQTINKIQTNRELMKRCSLIEKVKKLQKFGVVFTHSYPDVNPYIDKIKKLMKQKKRQVNFITLVQTTDQFKLGNFAALDALVLISSCYCSKLIDTIDLHIPMINFEELQISLGLKLKYGQLEWNENLIDEDEDEINDSQSTELMLNSNQALVESYLNENRWYGLQVNAGQDELSKLEPGLNGLAMNYNELEALSNDAENKCAIND